MPVLEQKPLRKIDIARAMGWAKSYLSQSRFEGMPAFYRIEDFKAWYNATKARGGPDGTVMLARSDKPAGGGQTVVIDWDSYTTPSERQAEETVARCEKVSDMAYALLDGAIRSGDIGAAFGSLKNWSEALKQTADVKQRFIELQQAERKVLPLDDVMSVVGMVLQTLRTGLERANKRLAARLSPDDPAAVLEVLSEALDETFETVTGAEQKIREALTQPVTQDEHHLRP